MLNYYTRTYFLIMQITLVLMMSSVVSIVEAVQPSCVLVTSENSSVEETSLLDIRRIYLGLAVSNNNRVVKPVINTSSKDLYREFLKNIMHMTEKGYKRKLVKRVFRQGGRKILSIDSTVNLVEYLRKNPDNVSFMKYEDARNQKALKIIQVLW